MILSAALARLLKAAGCLLVVCVASAATGPSQQTASAPRFRAIAFYTGTSDLAHVSFVREANRWLPEVARTHNLANKTNKELSSTFSEGDQNALITNALLWLGDRSR